MLMGFNVMLWGFIQYDAYNHVITSMSQRDQQAVCENLIPVNATYPTGGPLSIIVNNLGGSSVSIAAIYIWNTNRSEEHTSELQSQSNLVCRLLLEKKKKNKNNI